MVDTVQTVVSRVDIMQYLSLLYVTLHMSVCATNYVEKMGVPCFLAFVRKDIGYLDLIAN